MIYDTKDSGDRIEFPSGSQRDTQEWKPRYDLISIPALTRISHLLARWAVKYWERNWEKGQPTDRFLSSMMRHMFQYAEWKTDEDHLAAVCFNAMAIMHMQDSNTNWEFDKFLKNPADYSYLNAWSITL